MCTRTRSVGLLIGVVLALSALGAQAASASKFMSQGNVNYSLTAPQVAGENHVLTIDGVSANCDQVEFFADSASSPLETIRLGPTYFGCDAFGFLFPNAGISTIGCDYLLSAGSETSSGVFGGSIKVDCFFGPIEIDGGTCEAEIADGTVISSGITLENMVADGDVTIKFGNASVAVKKTKDGFLCPFSGTGATTATYTGNTTARAKNGGGSPVSFTVEP